MNEPVNIYIGSSGAVEKIKQGYSKVITQAHELEGFRGPIIVHLANDCHLLNDWPAIARALHRLPTYPIIYLYD